MIGGSRARVFHTADPAQERKFHFETLVSGRSPENGPPPFAFPVQDLPDNMEPLAIDTRGLLTVTNSDRLEVLRGTTVRIQAKPYVGLRDLVSGSADKTSHGLSLPHT